MNRITYKNADGTWGIKGYAFFKTEKETVISPKNYGMFLQKGKKKLYGG